MLKQAKAEREDPAIISLKFLAFLASDAEQLGRFIALSGLAPSDLRQNLQSPAFQAGLLDFVLSDESLLLAFAANAGINPSSVMQARARLPGFAP